LLIEHESATDRKLLIDLSPFIDSLLKEGRKDLITLLLTGDFSQQKDLHQKILQHETASRYFLNVNPHFFASKIKERGGFEQLSQEEKITLLPLLPPDAIREVIADVDLATYLNIEIAFDDVNDSLQKMLDLVYTQRVIYLKWEGQDETANLIEVVHFLNKIPFVSLAAAAKQEPVVLAYLRAMTDQQLAVVIPQIDPSALIAHFKEIRIPHHATINYARVANFLRFATVEQKKTFLTQLKKDIPSFSNFALGMLHAAAVDLKGTLKERAEDLVFSTEVDQFFLHLRKPAAVILPKAEEIPEKFICPISGDLMEDPVIVQPSGKIYDRVSIETWLKSPYSKNLDPFTRQEVTSIEPAVGIKTEIDTWRQKSQKKITR